MISKDLRLVLEILEKNPDWYIREIGINTVCYDGRGATNYYYIVCFNEKTSTGLVIGSMKQLDKITGVDYSI